MGESCYPGGVLQWQQRPYGSVGTGVAGDASLGCFRAYHGLQSDAEDALRHISSEEERRCARTALSLARQCYDNVLNGQQAQGLRLPQPEAEAWEMEARHAGQGLCLLEQLAEEAGVAPAPLGGALGCFCGCQCPPRDHLSPRAAGDAQCEGVWLQCGGCRRWCHGECAGQERVAASHSQGQGYTYYCPSCEQGTAPCQGTFPGTFPGTFQVAPSP